MKITTVILYISLALLLPGCSNDSVTNSKTEPMAVVFIWCMKPYVHYPVPGIPTYVPLSVNNITGYIFSDPIAKVESVYVLDSLSEQADLSQNINEDGSVLFYLSMPPIYNPQSTVNCNIKTTVGDFTGFENIPGNITDLRIVNGDTLFQGDSLKINWNAEYTSFFAISIYLRYNYTSTWENYFIADSLIFGESISLPPAILNKIFNSENTEVSYTIIQYNGPLPVTGSMYNMNQENKGFLFCSLNWTSFNFKILNDGSITNIDSSMSTNNKENWSVNNKIMMKLFGQL